jgi:hypothetical protein
MGLVRSGCSLTLPLNPAAAAVRAKAPIYPRLDRPGGRGGTGFPRVRQAAGARCEGGKSGIPNPSQVGSVCTHAPAPRRAGPLSGARVPSRALSCGAGRLVRRIRGGERIG